MKLLYTSIGINLFIILVVILVRPHLPPVVPLLYGKVISEAQLVPSFWLIIPALVSIGISTFNFVTNKYLIKDHFLKNALIYSSFFINLLVAITVFKIIFLVGLF